MPHMTIWQWAIGRTTSVSAPITTANYHASCCYRLASARNAWSVQIRSLAMRLCRNVCAQQASNPIPNATYLYILHNNYNAQKTIRKEGIRHKYQRKVYFSLFTERTVFFYKSFTIIHYRIWRVTERLDVRNCDVIGGRTLGWINGRAEGGVCGFHVSGRRALS